VLFFITAFIIATACSAITIKTLVGYSDLKPVYKITIGAFIILGWFGMFILNLLKKQQFLGVEFYSVISTFLYSLMGIVFILFICIILRDIVWYMLFYLVKLLKLDAMAIDPQNLSLLNRANLVVLFFTIIISGYAFYEGYKKPDIIQEVVYSDKISRSLRIAHVSDMHITRATPNNKIMSVINEINMLNPDIIVLTGDTIDDNINLIQDKLTLLSSFSAPYGVYAVMGNHEFYNDVYEAKKIIEAAGIKFLFNGGVHISNSNIYLTGIPDFTTMFERINLWRSIKDSKKDDYKILLSHQPIIINSLNKDLYDMVLSGHTHGGQVFPMHLMAKKANQYLAGRYLVNGINLFVSRGVGNWGPQMRLFAPSDVILIDLLKK